MTEILSQNIRCSPKNSNAMRPDTTAQRDGQEWGGGRQVRRNVDAALILSSVINHVLPHIT